jgi:hypothetical protein
MEMEKRDLAGSSSPRDASTIWKEIWRLKVPNVEKNFMWRACHDILPTRKNLCRIDNPRCPIYDLEEETAVHVLWECPSVRDMWSVGSMKLQKSTITRNFFLQIGEDVFQRCSAEEILMFVCIARRIWLRRNEVVHEGIFLHPNTIVCRSQCALDDFGMVSSYQSRK